MGATTTVMFADLTGSTGVFEALGNQAATQAVTGLTDRTRIDQVGRVTGEVYHHTVLIDRGLRQRSHLAARQAETAL